MSNQNEVASEALVTQLYKGRERRMYPEVAEYLRRWQEVAWAEEDRATDYYDDQSRRERTLVRAAQREGRQFDRYGADADAHRAFREENRRREEEMRRLNEEGRAGLRSLLVDSPHREVKWIAEHCLFHNEGGEVEGYARDILAILPATTEEIWEEAKSNRGMCDVFDRFFDQAESDGVFNGGLKMAGAREMQALRNYLRRNYGGSYVAPMMDRVKPIMKAMQEDYDRRLAEARAEWQGLDEAWRSERSRRAAATRAANREAEAAQEAPVESHPQTSESQPETPKASAQENFALVNGN